MFVVKASAGTGKSDWRSNLAMHSTEDDPINKLVLRNDVADIDNYSYKRMAVHPQNGIKAYHGSDQIGLYQNMSHAQLR